MARRFNSRYFLQIGPDQEVKLSAAEWRDYGDKGWIEPTPDRPRVARCRRGVIASLRGGKLSLFPVVRIPTFCAGWFRAWLYKIGTIQASQIAETWEERQERVALERYRDADNEATLWRISRNSQGPNEFCWMTSKQKADVLGAML